MNCDYGMARPTRRRSVTIALGNEEGSGPMSIVVLGIDLGENVCSLAGLDETGAVVLRRRMKREGVIDFVAKMPALIVAMEACCGAHDLGRVLAGKGHTIRLMSPKYVRPYVKANNNDDHDAAAIAEAATRPRRASGEAGTLPHGWDSCHGRRRRVNAAARRTTAATGRRRQSEPGSPAPTRAPARRRRWCSRGRRIRRARSAWPSPHG